MNKLLINLVYIFGCFKWRKKGKYRVRTRAKFGAFVTAIVSVMLFIILEDLSGQIAVIDRWTVLFICTAVIQMIFKSIKSNRETKHDEA